MADCTNSETSRGHHVMIQGTMLIDFYHGIDALLNFDQTQKQNTQLEKAKQN